MAVTNTNTGTLKFTVNVGGKAFSISDGGPYSGSVAQNVEKVITAGATNVEIDIVVPHSSIQLVGLAADQALAVKVNSTSTPTETFALAPSAGVVWGADFATVNPFGTDITKLYVSNAGVNDAKFHFAVLHN